MLHNLLNEIEKLKKREEKFLNTKDKENVLKKTIYEKVPPTLCQTLEKAFTKAFSVVFINGTELIEKSFDKENAQMEFDAGNFVIDKNINRKSLRRLDKSAQSSTLLNTATTTATGLGMGLLGFGLPDIPLLVSTLLKGIYELCIGYGFSYESDDEKIYILRLIRTALCESNERTQFNSELESMIYSNTTIQAEIIQTAKVLSDALLVEKFVQGIPIVGVVGGFVNHVTYRKVSTIAEIKYKKRYLQRKLEEYKQLHKK